MRTAQRKPNKTNKYDAYEEVYFLISRGLFRELETSTVITWNKSGNAILKIFSKVLTIFDKIQNKTSEFRLNQYFRPDF